MGEMLFYMESGIVGECCEVSLQSEWRTDKE